MLVCAVDAHLLGEKERREEKYNSSNLFYYKVYLDINTERTQYLLSTKHKFISRHLNAPQNHGKKIANRSF